MISRVFALFVVVGTAIAQMATLSVAAMVEVWLSGMMPGRGANEPAAKVPQNDGVHSISNVSRPTLAPLNALRPFYPPFRYSL